MKNLDNKCVLITGGAQGIGFEMALAFAREGCTIVISDINEKALLEAEKKLAPVALKVLTAVMDVTDVKSVEALATRLAKEAPVDILINNAGVVFGGDFAEVDLKKHHLTLDVNAKGPMNVTYYFYKMLCSRPEAHIVNIASASGFIGLPYGSSYAASKWAAIGFSESIRLELEMTKQNHVGVTTVCPSYINTGMFDGVKPPKMTQLLHPETLAQKVVHAVQHKQTFVLEPFLVKFTPLLKGLLPTKLMDRLSWSLGVSSSMTSWRGHKK